MSNHSNSSGNVDEGFVSISEEIQIGQQIHQQITSEFYLYTEPKAREYIESIGQKLAAAAERQEIEYHFFLLYSNKIHATSAPGGFVYVTTGMLNFLDNEAQLAAVLAHEIGELQYRDPRLSEKRKAWHEISRAGAGIAPAFGPFGILAAIGFVAVHAATSAVPEDPAKRMVKADSLALDYLIESGYDPQAMLDLMGKFLRADSKTLPYFYDYYQNRPISQERMDNLEESFAKTPLEGKSLTTNYHVYQEQTKGIREIYKT
ncbi:MAG: M48 family metalloprotease [Candidatus Omnitrophica bacterium]|nr:M48 family metalloprotease [Candidatus Omnitrophota bacterium]